MKDPVFLDGKGRVQPERCFHLQQRGDRSLQGGSGPPTTPGIFIHSLQGGSGPQTTADTLIHSSIHFKGVAGTLIHSSIHFKGVPQPLEVH